MKKVRINFLDDGRISMVFITENINKVTYRDAVCVVISVKDLYEIIEENAVKKKIYIAHGMTKCIEDIRGKGIIYKPDIKIKR